MGFLENTEEGEREMIVNFLQNMLELDCCVFEWSRKRSMDEWHEAGWNGFCMMKKMMVSMVGKYEIEAEMVGTGVGVVSCKSL